MVFEVFHMCNPLAINYVLQLSVNKFCICTVVRYAEMCHAIDSELRALEVRVGTRTQHLPVWIRIIDKDSNWGWNNGLKTLIPQVLTFR